MKPKEELFFATVLGVVLSVVVVVVVVILVVLVIGQGGG